MTYHTDVIALIWIALAILAELVRENNRMSAGRRRLCYAEFALIATSAFAEWLSVALGQVSGLPAWPVLVSKWADYVLTPLAGGAIAWQLRIHNRWEKTLNVLLVLNVVFQTIAFASGRMVVIDDHNHYVHGDLHAVYVAIYLTVFAIIGVQFALYGRFFSRQNRGSLYMILALVFAGIALQELHGGDSRVAYLALALGAILLYIRNGEFYQLAQDENMEEQRTLLMVDDLTGAGSRRAYSEALGEITTEDTSDDLAAFCIDVNGLKETNDVLGHAAGDELIRATSYCIQDVFSPLGRCYRTGGDEFVVFTHMDKEEAEEALALLERTASAWKGEIVKELHLACGYALAADWPDSTTEELVMRADEAMYEAKEAYYRQEGNDRRRRR